MHKGSGFTVDRAIHAGHAPVSQKKKIAVATRKNV